MNIVFGKQAPHNFEGFVRPGASLVTGTPDASNSRGNSPLPQFPYETVRQKQRLSRRLFRRQYRRVQGKESNGGHEFEFGGGAGCYC